MKAEIENEKQSRIFKGNINSKWFNWKAHFVKIEKQEEERKLISERKQKDFEKLKEQMETEKEVHFLKEIK